MKNPSFNEGFIRFWLMKFRKFDISQKKQRKALIEIFVNAIFLYDDRMLITFNYKDGTQTVRFEDTLTANSAEEKSLDLFSYAGPKLFSRETEELLLYLELLQTTEPQSFGRLRLCFILLYLPSARSFASFSNKGLRYWPVKLPGTSATCSGVPSATMRPPALPPSGPRSMM